MKDFKELGIIMANKEHFSKTLISKRRVMINKNTLVNKWYYKFAEITIKVEKGGFILDV